MREGASPKRTKLKIDPGRGWPAIPFPRRDANEHLTRRFLPWPVSLPLKLSKYYVSATSFPRSDFIKKLDTLKGALTDQLTVTIGPQFFREVPNFWQTLRDAYFSQKLLSICPEYRKFLPIFITPFILLLILIVATLIIARIFWFRFVQGSRFYCITLFWNHLC